MEKNIIKIKCPRCGAILRIANAPGIDDKTATCPVCKQKLRIGDCDRVVPKAVEKTEYPEKTEYQYGGIPSSGKVGPEATTVDDEHIVNYTLGQLTVLSSGECFRLKPGRNTVGRRTDSIPHADFEIMTNSNRMSRLHIVIVVRKVVGQGYMHYVSLCGQKANATFVGDNRLEVGDCLVLNDGDVLKLPDKPDISVKFEIPNSEKTQYD